MLSIPEVLAHPGFKDIIPLPEPDRKGTAVVAQNRAGTVGKGVGISWEIYGRGDVSIVWVMGLNGPKVSWHRQARYFGVENVDKYSCLVFDNRGVGHSETPLARYSTSEMAKDLLELLEHVGWNKERKVHLVGVSMGGMIAQEFALLAPQLLASLTLQSTAATLNNSVPWYTQLTNRIIMLVPKPFLTRVKYGQSILFSSTWLDAPDELGVFPTNADRHLAEELWRQENLPTPVWQGFLLQALAASWHSVKGERLKRLRETGIKVPVLVMTGTRDLMIEEKHSVELVEGIGGGEEGEGKVRLVRFEGAGHVLSWERREEYNKLLKRYFDEAEEAYGRGRRG